MLVILLSWLYVVFISYVYGHALFAFLAFFVKEKLPVHFSVTILSGLALLAVVASYMSLFIKIGMVANILIATGALVYLFIKRRAFAGTLRVYAGTIKNTPLLACFIFLLALGMALVLSLSPLAKFDDGLYYQQSIKWIENYPAIAGLGNLHLKLSFNSSWHVLSALFSFSFLGLQLNDLNGLFFLLIILFAMDGLVAILRKQYRFSDVFKVVSLAPLHLLYHYVISPSPDLVVPYIVWIIFVLFLHKVEQGRQLNFDMYTLLILVLSVFAVIIKLSAAPIALLSFYLLALQLKQKHIGTILPVAIVVLLMVLPWFARNVILSGYLVYPFYQLDVLHVDWKVPVELVQLEVLETKSFAKVKGMLFTEVAVLPFSEWIPYWFKQLQASEKIIILINVGLTLVVPVIAAVYLYKNKFTLEKAGYCMLGATVVAGIVFWFATAPHFRYGMAFLLALYLLCASCILYFYIKKYSVTTAYILPVLLIIFFAKPVYDTINRHIYHKQYEPSFVVPKAQQFANAKMVNYQGINMYVPEATAQCWGSPLPCVPFIVDGLELRNGNIQGGFRIAQANPHEYSIRRLESMKKNGVNYNFLKHKSVQ
jgi:hypothetical protein